jgi:hypothetical protein
MQDQVADLRLQSFECLNRNWTKRRKANKISSFMRIEGRGVFLLKGFCRTWRVFINEVHQTY